MIFKEYKNGKITLSIGGKFIGEITLIDREDPGAYIKLLHVKDKYQNQGYGKALLGYATLKAKFAGCVSICLFVSVSNVGAIRFYERYGFFKSFTKNNPKKDPHYLMVKQII